MAINPNIQTIDPQLISQRTYDVANDAVRVSVGSAQFTIEGEGLSVSGAMTHSQSGLVIPLTACPGIKEFQLYAVATTATTGSITVTLDVTPDVAGNVVYVTPTTLTLGASLINAVAVSAIQNTLIAQNAQVTITSNALGVGEIVTVYLVGNSF